MNATLIRATLVCLALASAASRLSLAGEHPGDACCISSDGCLPVAPTWIVRAGFVLLDRSSADGAILVTDSFGPAGTELLDASDLSFGFEFGPDLTIVRQGPCHEVSFRWFQVHDWLASTPPEASPNGAVIRFAAPLGNTLLPAEVSSAYASQLDSFELNLERPLVGAWQGLAGVRYLQLNETLQIDLDIGPGINQVVSLMDASNQLWGAQLGVRRALGPSCGPWEFDAAAKAGLYGVESTSRIAVSQTTGIIGQSLAEATGLAFVAELGLSAQYAINDCLAIRAGYQLLWIEGAALAPEQIAVSDPLSGLAGIDTSGGAFYHGGALALVLSW